MLIICCIFKIIRNTYHILSCRWVMEIWLDKKNVNKMNMNLKIKFEIIRGIHARGSNNHEIHAVAPELVQVYFDFYFIIDFFFWKEYKYICRLSAFLMPTFSNYLKYLISITLMGHVDHVVKFIYSEKATKFCKIPTNYLSYVLPCQSNNWWRFRKILWPSQNIRTLRYIAKF